MTKTTDHDSLEDWLPKLIAAKARLIACCPGSAQFFVDVWAKEHGKQFALPFLSIRAFKETTIFNKSLDLVQRRFLSSGSTGLKQGSRATKLLSDEGLAAYAATAATGFAEFLQRFEFASNATVLCLVPRATDWPDSSLAEMFEILHRQNFDVQWCTPATVFAELEKVSHDTVVFGTSFHHVQAAAHARTRAPTASQSQRSILAVDTGGTKGKTQALGVAEMKQLLVQTYEPFGNLQVASEYGMCELTSQAWSLAAGELKQFRCNPLLHPVCINPRTFEAHLHAQPVSGEETFLAFVDWSNVDSYPAIITEDLGTLGLEPGEFILHGRAPLASAKGCSLRVEAEPAAVAPASTFYHDSKPFGSHVPLHKACVNRSKLEHIRARLLQLIEKAASSQFTAFEIELLRSAVETIQATPTLHTSSNKQAHGQFRNKSLLIVAAANMPMTFLFPIVAAFETGYNFVAVHMPSLREDDPLSAAVRLQISWLLEALQEAFQFSCQKQGAPKESFQIVQTRRELLANQQRNTDDVDTVLAFGTDQTVSFLKEHFNAQCTNYIGLGEVENFLRVTGKLEKGHAWQVAQACLAWKGRGCLTPRAVIFDAKDMDTDTRQLESYIAELCTHYRNLHRQEFTLVEPLLECLHWHDTIELKAKLLPWARFDCQAGTVIVDCTRCSNESWFAARQTLQDALDFSKAGQGLLFLLRAEQANQLNRPFNYLSVVPGYHDPHMGKTWTEWLGAPSLHTH